MDCSKLEVDSLPQKDPTKWRSRQNERVLILTDDLGGGTGNHLLSMIKHWDKNRWEVEILSRAPLADRVRPDVPVRYLPPSGRPKLYPFSQIRELGRIRKNIRERDPSIVHSYFFWSNMFGRILKREGKIRALIENREDQGFGWGPHEYFWLRITRRIPDLIVCVSEAVRQIVLDREGLDGERVVVIRNGVEAAGGESREKAAREELGLEEANLVVGMVANYNRPVKGVEYLIEAIPRVVASVPDARFLLIGGGEEEGALRAKARALNVESFVVFAGYRKDVERLYGIMDISVLTSLSEGLSLTVLESMAHGLPVVATRVGGNPEVITDGQTGYLVPPRDPCSLANRIIRLLLDADLRRRMGGEGRAHIGCRFRMQDVADRYLDVYRRVISR